METILLLGTASFLLMVIVGGIRVLHASRAFERYLKEHHRPQWESLYQDQRLTKSLLWPVMQNTPVDFIWKSQEDFGDARIAELRARVRTMLIGTWLAMVATVAWFGIGALVLTYIFPRK